ncbi:MAG: hypothetical protein WD036_00805 [Bauldia sp.]
MDTFVLSGLVKKRAQLAGDIENAQTDLQRMIRDLENLHATIRLFDADYDIPAIKPKSFRPPDNWSKRGEMTRIILNVLRQASEPLTTRDVAFQVMAERALDTGDVRLLRLMTKRCGVALRYQRDKGLVRSAQGPCQYHTWEIAR